MRQIARLLLPFLIALALVPYGAAAGHVMPDDAPGQPETMGHAGHDGHDQGADPMPGSAGHEGADCCDRSACVCGCVVPQGATVLAAVMASTQDHASPAAGHIGLRHARGTIGVPFRPPA